MNEKKKMRIFLLIAFGVPALLSIFMWIAHRRGLDAGAFPLAWMFLPAAAAMAAKKRFETPEQPFPRAFYWTYLAITGAMILSSVASAFVASRAWGILTNALVIAGGIVILIEILAMGKEKRAAIGLSFGKNAGKTGLGALLFVVLYALGFALNVLLTMWIKGVRWSEISQTFSFYPLGVISLLLSLPLSYLAFFGEEYGWRGFFQPALYIWPSISRSCSQKNTDSRNAKRRPHNQTSSAKQSAQTGFPFGRFLPGLIRSPVGGCFWAARSVWEGSALGCRPDRRP